MGYYTRVLSRRADCPTLEELRAPLRVVYPDVKLTTDQPQSQSESKAPEWADLVLRHDDGLEIAAIERNMVEPGSLGAEEIAEFIDAIADGEPASAASWLTSYLPHVRAIYAFQHLAGTRERRGDEALQAVSDAIWARGEAILQGDGEGFTNDSGDHILWQFSDDVSGPWWMAVLRDGAWVRFQMELGDARQREAFRAGRVPDGVKIG